MQICEEYEVRELAKIHNVEPKDDFPGGGYSNPYYEFDLGESIVQIRPDGDLVGDEHDYKVSINRIILLIQQELHTGNE
jgi:hypothetical protein